MAQTIRPALRTELLTAGAGGTVLVADFQPFSAGRRIGELLAAGDADLTVRQVDPARDLARDGAYLALDEMAAGYTDSFQEVDVSSSTTVVGYCSAAVLALRIASRLAAGGRNVAAVLVRPTWPNPEQIGSIFDKIWSDLGGAERQHLEWSGDPRATLAVVEEKLRDALGALAVRHGVDPSSRPLREMRDRYRGWFSYLLAAQDALRRPWTCDVTVQVYADAAEPACVPWFEPGGYRSRLFPLPDDEATAARQLAEAMLDQLRGHRA